jgi:antitoxin (DNA-binding transcriptional repressor) of toxin-antitoxin stability system
MRKIGAFEAKSKLGQLLDWIGAGEEVRITRRGKAIAKLVAPSTASIVNAPRRRRAHSCPPA